MKGCGRTNPRGTCDGRDDEAGRGDLAVLAQWTLQKRCDGGSGWILFAYGGRARAILNALRDAAEPMSTADMVERVALDCRIATEAPDIAATLLAGVRAALAKLGKRGM